MIENNNSKQKNENGFTLVEMAIALVIVGLLLAFATVGFSKILNRDFEKKTFSNMEIIADAISIYTQRHMRVPCPADPTGVDGTTVNGEPFGTEINSGTDGDVFGNCNSIAEAEGIIPFTTLGLPKHLAKDAFGNYITYRVSIASSQSPATASTQEINNWCMTRPRWHADTNNDGTTDDYVNLPKAAFCCGTWDAGGIAGVTGDIDIQGSFGPLPNLSRAALDSGTGANAVEYRTSAANPPTRDQLMDPVIPGFVTGVDTTVIPSFPAYILISHGENGDGAYSRETGVRVTSGMANPELENVDGDVQFFAPDRLASVDPGVGNQPLFVPNIDDLVFWATPSQILSRVGGVSCNAP